MNTPGDCKYTTNDEWIKVEGTTGTIGITDHAQEQLSDVVYVEIVVDVGDEVSQGDTAATIESVKAAADVYFPASGTVTAINEGLPDQPETVNSDPYGKAWMVKIELSEPSEVDGLLDAKAYEAHVAAQE